MKTEMAVPAILAAAVILVYLMIKSTPGFELSEEIIPLSLIIGGGIAASAGIVLWNRRRIQSVENTRVRHDPRLGRILYLRPFLADSRVRVANPRKSGAAAKLTPFLGGFFPAQVSLDEAIRLGLSSFGELVSLGDGDDHIGAPRFRSDENWRDHVLRFADAAPLVVVYLGVKPGTLDEVEMIFQRRELLARTIFIFPLRHAADGGVWSPTAIADHLRMLGLDVPPDPASGEAMLFDAAGGFRDRTFVLTQGRLDAEELRLMAGLALTRS